MNPWLNEVGSRTLPVIGVDIGNSAIKLGIPGADGELERYRLERLDPQFLPELSSDMNWTICSVDSDRLTELSNWLQMNRNMDQLHIVSAHDVPIKTNVDDREKVGRDRLVAAWNAWDIFGEELVVIDAGTAVTIDHVDKNGVFQGGVIFPGAGSCLKLLATSTTGLPNLLEHKFILEDLLKNVIGKNTENAILRGVYQSQMSAMKMIATNISRGARIIATGGEIEFLSPVLPKEWIYDPMLVVQGAWKIGSMIFTGK